MPVAKILETILVLHVGKILILPTRTLESFQIVETRPGPECGDFAGNAIGLVP